MATTVRIPMQLLTVQPDSANAFWTATNNTVIDEAYIRYVDGGEGISTWWGVVPANVNATENWNIDYYCASNTNGSSVVLVTAAGRHIAHGGLIDGAYTTLSSANNITLLRSGTMNIVSASGGNFDSVLALTATGYLILQLTRHGGAAGDTVSSNWDLYNVNLRVDI